MADHPGAPSDRRRLAEIPSSVTQSEGYNHIGDLTWNPGDGGRVILPMECYSPVSGNTCGHGAFGVADPSTLAFNYYVNLDPSEIPKAMWAETSPDGKLIWTSSGNDLLAYRTSDVTAANQGPSGPAIHSVRRLQNAVPPSGITGAVFGAHGRLLAGEDNGAFQVWSVNTTNGARQLELETRLCGESEGLDVIPMLGGTLHWLISPFASGMHADLRAVERPAPLRPAAATPGVHRKGHQGRGRDAARNGSCDGSREAGWLPDARRSGELRRWPGPDQRQWTRHRLDQPGATGAVQGAGAEGDDYGISALVPVGMDQAKRGAPVPRRGAG